MLEVLEPVIDDKIQSTNTSGGNAREYVYLVIHASRLVRTRSATKYIMDSIP